MSRNRPLVLFSVFLALTLVLVIGHFSFLRPVPERVSVVGQWYKKPAGVSAEVLGSVTNSVNVIWLSPTLTTTSWVTWCSFESPSGFTAHWPATNGVCHWPKELR